MLKRPTGVEGGHAQLVRAKDVIEASGDPEPSAALATARALLHPREAIFADAESVRVRFRARARVERWVSWLDQLPRGGTVDEAVLRAQAQDRSAPAIGAAALRALISRDPCAGSLGHDRRDAVGCVSAAHDRDHPRCLRLVLDAPDLATAGPCIEALTPEACLQALRKRPRSEEVAAALVGRIPPGPELRAVVPIVAPAAALAIVQRCREDEGAEAWLLEALQGRGIGSRGWSERAALAEAAAEALGEIGGRASLAALRRRTLGASWLAHGLERTQEALRSVEARLREPEAGAVSLNRALRAGRLSRPINSDKSRGPSSDPASRRRRTDEEEDSVGSEGPRDLREGPP